MTFDTLIDFKYIDKWHIRLFTGEAEFFVKYDKGVDKIAYKISSNKSK